MRPTTRLASLAVVMITVGTGHADADVLKCQRAITKASAQFFQATTKASDTCEAALVKAGAGTCPDAKATAAVQKATIKLASTIATACGGSDRICNADAIDEHLPAALGWPDVCPNIATAYCDQPIATCGDIATCLVCLGTEASTSANDLAYGALALPSSGDPALNACQRAIGKANAIYLRAESKALAACWRARQMGQHGDSCAPPATGDGKYLAQIAKADEKRTRSIAKACGGADHTLGGVDDRTPAEIGFADACPSVTVPGGPACGAPITDLTGLVACLDCVAAAAAACVDRAPVPQLATYPSECAGCFAPPMTSACPTSLALTTAADRVDLDLGFTGLGHEATLPSNSGITLAVSGCAGTNHPTCGACTLNGPVADAGGPSAASRRCLDHSWTACGSDTDCGLCGGGANDGAACTNASECPGGGCVPSSCVFFLGPPQGLSTGGFPFCAMNEIVGPVAGTVDLTDGSMAAQLSLRTRLYAMGPPEHPCPRCVAGLCTDGPRSGEACTVQGGGLRGDVTLDCPPSPSADAGTFNLTFPLTTGSQARSIVAASPSCRETGFSSLRCLCDSCNTLNAEACATNADCPTSGGAPGICGGRRCVGGSEGGKPCSVCLGGGNHGATCVNGSACPGGTCSVGCGGICVGGPNADAPCAVSSECPASSCSLGICGRPGEPTKPNSCFSDTSLPGDPPLCAGNSAGEGECVIGPSDDVCSIQTFRSCSTDDDCACEDCVPGQQCVQKPRPCFADNGTPGNPVVVTGKPGLPCGGIARPTLGGFACVSPVGAHLVNSAFGLPGLSRLRLPVDVP